ncbi:MAG: C40 family peptidase [Proteobacteria bacterium]|nr:C40 family peptidase [Pseudomonadota bacterium]
MLAPSFLDELAAPDWLPREPAGSDAPVPASNADPRHLLVDFAMTLRDIRYRRGGRSPHSGFDCSGFVHYVFAQVLGVELPGNSAAQFRDGRKIARDALEAGDLVFFRTRGKRISHVGIYVGGGRFIHSPTTGERVRVDRLGENYWARRFAGARRPDALI